MKDAFIETFEMLNGDVRLVEELVEPRGVGPCNQPRAQRRRDQKRMPAPTGVRRDGEAQPARVERSGR